MTTVNIVTVVQVRVADLAALDLPVIRLRHTEGLYRPDGANRGVPIWVPVDLHGPLGWKRLLYVNDKATPAAKAMTDSLSNGDYRLLTLAHSAPAGGPNDDPLYFAARRDEVVEVQMITPTEAQLD